MLVLFVSEYPADSVLTELMLFSLDRPTPPRNVTVSNIRGESCYLNWDAPLDNGGSELTNYIIEKKEVVTEVPEVEEGQEAPPEPQWEEVTNSIIERKYGVCLYNSSTNYKLY